MTNCVMFKKDYLHDVCRKKFVLKVNALVEELTKWHQLWALNEYFLRYNHNIENELNWMLELLDSDASDLTKSLVDDLITLNNKVNKTLDVRNMYDIVNADGKTLLTNTWGYTSNDGYDETLVLSDGRKVVISYYDDGVPGSVRLV